MNKKFYVITDSEMISKDKLRFVIEETLRGGADIIQLREKEADGLSFYNTAVEILKLTKSYGVPLIIDDRVDIALAADASGVHLGQSDLPIAVARKLLGKDKIIGATAKTPEEAKKAMRDGADYLGVGAIFETTTKVKTRRTEISTLIEIKNSVSIPVYAIGGINLENVSKLSDTNIDGICVVSAVMKSEDPFSDTQVFKNKINKIL